MTAEVCRSHLKFIIFPVLISKSGRNASIQILQSLSKLNKDPTIYPFVEPKVFALWRTLLTSLWTSATLFQLGVRNDQNWLKNLLNHDDKAPFWSRENQYGRFACQNCSTTYIKPNMEPEILPFLKASVSSVDFYKSEKKNGGWVLIIGSTFLWMRRICSEQATELPKTNVINNLW